LNYIGEGNYEIIPNPAAPLPLPPPKIVRAEHFRPKMFNRLAADTTSTYLKKSCSQNYGKDPKESKFCANPFHMNFHDGDADEGQGEGEKRANKKRKNGVSAGKI
jgi:hypothetical protein